MKPSRATLLFFFVMVAAGVFALIRLFAWRFESGDIYPAYSTFRADPVGTKAIYEALRSTRGLTCERNQKPLEKFHSDGPATLFYIGGASFITARLNDFATVAQPGGRVVVALLPAAERRFGSEAKPPEGKAPEKFSATSTNRPLGFRLRNQHATNPENIVAQSTIPGVPAEVQWHSENVFTDLGDEWRPVYKRGDYAVAIERNAGRGTIVLMTDSYLLSNEAMRKDRQTELIEWLVGGNAHVVFDETHLGVSEDPGVAALVRKYRLHGLVCGLLFFGVLFVWRSSTSLIPPLEIASPTSGPVRGRDSAEGFVHLLRRNIAASKLLNTCFEQWIKTPPRTLPAARLARAKEIAAAAEATNDKAVLETYRAITRVLTDKGIK